MRAACRAMRVVGACPGGSPRSMARITAAFAAQASGSPKRASSDSKRHVLRVRERFRDAPLVLRWVRRVEGETGHPTCGYADVRRVRELRAEQARQHVRMRSGRGCAALGRDPLVHLDSSQARERDAVRARRDDRAGGILPRAEQRLARGATKAGEQTGLRRAHAERERRRAEAADRRARAVRSSPRIASRSGSELGDYAPRGTLPRLRQGEEHAVMPGHRRHAQHLVGERARRRVRPRPDRAARRDDLQSYARRARRPRARTRRARRRCRCSSRSTESRGARRRDPAPAT